MMKISNILTAVVLTLLAWHAPAHAGEPADTARRPITQVYGLEIGGANINCSYLSPLPYTGWGMGWYGGWGKAMRQNPEHLVMAFTAGLDMTSTLNPSETARMLSVSGRFGWGPSWRKKLPYNLELTLGGALDIFGGALWLPVNGNNPVQAMAYAGIDMTTGLSWRTHFGKLPVTFADRAWLPTLGAFFCQGYGETYYEIYLGNYKNLAHFGWWGNAAGLDNHLTMTLHFPRYHRALILGYRLAFRTFHANRINTQYVRNAFSIALQIN